MVSLSKEQFERYHRNILLDGVGEDGQKRLLEARVLIIGLGGLGAPAAYYLAAAGIGTLGLVDGDRVDLSNLQRQILHTTADLANKKTISAGQSIAELNPDVQLVRFDTFVDETNIDSILSGFDFVIDATDTFHAKFLINDGCLRAGVPLSHGGLSKFYGQTMTVLPGKSACCRCLFGEHAETASRESAGEGVLGALAGILGSIQAAEALKFFTGTGDLLVNTLLSVDVSSMQLRKVAVHPQKGCPACAHLR